MTVMSQTLAYLSSNTGRAVPAIEIAIELGLVGTHESRRRKVRRVIEALRNDGHKVCAGLDQDNVGGYWLARTPGEYSEYLASRRKDSIFVFVSVRRHMDAASERATKQGQLFDRPADGSREAWAHA